MEYLTIIIAKDFSISLGGRWKDLGHNSGEEFYETLLLPMYEKAISTNKDLHIYLDGVKAYPYSFLDQSFGKLAKIKGINQVRSQITLHAKIFKWVSSFILNKLWV